MIKSLIVSAAFLVSAFASFSQKTEILKFSVEAGKYQRINTPVSLDLADIIVSDTLSIQLYELVKGKQVEVPCQIEPGYFSRLWWIMDGTTVAGAKRDYVLYRNPGLNYKKIISAEVTSGKIELKKDQIKILDVSVKNKFAQGEIRYPRQS